jgi:hypothetical protein
MILPGSSSRKILAQFGMLQPLAAITTGCESGRQISGRIRT